jgi:HSP20 family protein
MTMLMEPLAPVLRDLNRLMAAGGGAPQAFLPPADVLITDEAVTVWMDVPGVSPDALEIELDNDTVTVRGERVPPFDTSGSERAWRHIERSFGRFERDLRVPKGLDPDSVEATMDNGVLTLRIPKPEPMRPRRIQIKDGAMEGTAQDATEGSSESGTQSAPAGATQGATQDQPAGGATA